MFDLIAFDADDTLWHNETLYHHIQDRFKQVLARYHAPEGIEERLFATEMRNLEYYGYGIKSYVLSMIETAVELSGGRIQGDEVEEIVGFAKEMMDAQVELLEGVQEAVVELAGSYPLMLITKGDLLDQERKLRRSGLAPYFKFIEIISNKTKDTYVEIMARRRVVPERFLMVGNSLKSDILPVIDLGGYAIYIPYHLTWAHEFPEESELQDRRYFELDDIRLLPAFIESLKS